MSTINVVDAGGAIVALEQPLPPGPAYAANARPVVLAAQHYVLVAAGVTSAILGATGASGDLLVGVLLVPADTSPGAVTVTDNVTTFTVFTGGATSLADLKPFRVDLGLFSTGGGWKLTTGASISAVAIGKFT